MKRALVALALVGAALVGLTGCDDDRPAQMTRDELYTACLEAGGSFEYNASLPYWQCSVPGAPLQK